MVSNFQESSYNLKRIIFDGAVFSVAIELNASAHDGEHSKKFIDDLWSQHEIDKPKNQKKWIRLQLENSFKSIGQSPVWVDEEPSWLYMNGKPMTFVGQLDIPVSDETPNRYSVYIFQTKIIQDVGFEIIHRIVTQYPD